MSTIIAATDADTLKNAAMGLSAVSLIAAVVLMKVISGIVGRVISTVILVAVALVGYSQRSDISSCIDAVKQATESAESQLKMPEEITCKFFGQNVTVKVPQLTK